jgi:hypothetical protein
VIWSGARHRTDPRALPNNQAGHGLWCAACVRVAPRLRPWRGLSVGSIGWLRGWAREIDCLSRRARAMGMSRGRGGAERGWRGNEYAMTSIYLTRLPFWTRGPHL